MLLGVLSITEGLQELASMYTHSHSSWRGVHYTSVSGWSMATFIIFLGLIPFISLYLRVNAECMSRNLMLLLLRIVIYHCDTGIALKLCSTRNLTHKLLLCTLSWPSCRGIPLRLTYATIIGTECSPPIAPACLVLLLLPPEVCLWIHVLSVYLLLLLLVLGHKRLFSFTLATPRLCWCIGCVTEGPKNNWLVVAINLHRLVRIHSTIRTHAASMFLLMGSIRQCIRWLIDNLLNQIVSASIWKILIISRWRIWIYLLLRLTRPLKQIRWNHDHCLVLLSSFAVAFGHNNILARIIEGFLSLTSV